MYKVGDLFHELFTIVDVLGGEGVTGEGLVYVIEHNVTKQRLAAKTYQPKVHPMQGMVHLQMQSAFTRALNGHPNIAHCHGLEYAPDGTWLYLEYVPGRTLRESLESGNLTFGRVIDWWIQLANAVAYIKRLGQINMDLTEDNIVITPSGRLKLIDISQLQDAELNQFELASDSKLLRARARDGFYTDLKAFGQIMQKSYNLCLVDEVKRHTTRAATDASAVGEWESGWKKVSEEFEAMYQLGGEPALLTSPTAPEEMASMDDEILEVVAKLRTSHRKKEIVHFDEILKSLNGFHRRIAQHADCTLGQGDFDYHRNARSMALAAEWHLRKKWHFLLGEYELADRYVEKAITADPDCAEAWRVKGDINREKGRILDAIQCYERSYMLCPDNTVLLVNYGNVLLHHGRQVQAEAVFLEALSRAPDSAVLLNNLGYLYEERDDLEQAASFYERAIEADPGYRKARDNLEIVRNKSQGHD